MTSFNEEKEIFIINIQCINIHRDSKNKNQTQHKAFTEVR